MQSIMSNTKNESQSYSPDIQDLKLIQKIRARLASEDNKFNEPSILPIKNSNLEPSFNPFLLKQKNSNLPKNHRISARSTISRADTQSSKPTTFLILCIVFVVVVIILFVIYKYRSWFATRMKFNIGHRKITNVHDGKGPRANTKNE